MFDSHFGHGQDRQYEAASPPSRSNLEMGCTGVAMARTAPPACWVRCISHRSSRPRGPPEVLIESGTVTALTRMSALLHLSYPLSRRTDMTIAITDLSATEQLDREARMAVRGGIANISLPGYSPP